jgi:endonuclease G
MPNVTGIAADSWRKYTTTVRAIEQKTGYDLLSALPRELQDDLETKGEIN